MLSLGLSGLFGVFGLFGSAAVSAPGFFVAGVLVPVPWMGSGVVRAISWVH